MMKRFMIPVFALACAYYAGAADLVGWWKMDAIEDGKIVDASGNGRDLTLGSGCSITNNSDLIGNALAYDGTMDAYALFSCPALTSRTVSLWFYRNDNDGPMDESVNTMPYIFNGISNMRAHYVNGSTGSSTTYVGTNYKPTTGSMLRESWTHYVWVYDATGIDGKYFKFYKNGVLSVSKEEASDDNISAAGTACLGNNNANGKDRFTRPICGALADVKVFDGALSDGEVMQEYGSKFQETKLLAHWPMNEVVTDASGSRLAKDSTGKHDLYLGAGVTQKNDFFGPSLFWDATTSAYGVYTNDVELHSYTFTAWMNASGDSDAYENGVAGNRYPRVYAFGGDYLHLSVNATAVSATHARSGRDSNKNIGKAMPAKDMWYHFAIVSHRSYNVAHSAWEDYREIFVNGELIETNVVAYIDAVNAVTVGETMILGNQGFTPSGANRPYLGSMADVRLYKGALVKDEIVRAMKGVADVSAGVDFTVARNTVMLRGESLTLGENTFRFGAPGTFLWELVSAPSGGEGATIESPDFLTTAVTLPVDGAYQFRLTASNDIDSKSDVVTVTRVAPAANTPPTVSITAASNVVRPAPLALTATVSDAETANVRVLWRKVSGPGGVYFTDPAADSTKALFTEAGTYVIACTADDGTDTTTATTTATTTVTVSGDGGFAVSTNNLAYYWNFEGRGADTAIDLVAGKKMVGKDGGSVKEPSLVGYGLRAKDVKSYVDAGCRVPDENKLSFAFWMYYDMADTNNTTYTRILANSQISFQLDGANKPASAAQSMIVYVGGNNKWHFKNLHTRVPGGMTNRWLHVAATFDVTPDAEDEKSNPAHRVSLYIDGKEISLSQMTGTIKDEADTDGLYHFPGKTKESANMRWGGSGTVSGSSPVSRIFPGILDEIRVYTNLLNAAEIARLAAEPTVVNRPPIAEVYGKHNLRGAVHGAFQVPCGVYDDGLPSGELTSMWELVSGDADAIDLPDAPNGSFLARKTGSYVVRLKADDGVSVSCSQPVTIEFISPGTVILIK